MTYRPRNTSKKEKMLALITAFAAIVLFAVGGFVEYLPGVYQITAIIMAITSIELYMKYVGSDYVYEAAENSLKIHKITGKKSICVCSLDYEMSLSLVVSSKEFLKDKSKYPKTDFNVNYAKNLAPEKYSVYFFLFNDKKCMAKFEPDETFTEYVNEKITIALKNAEKEQGWEEKI